MPGWSLMQVRNAAVSTPFTKDFRHLQPVPRHWTKRVGALRSQVKVVKPKDRIKYWNIVPGDQVRIRGDADGKILEVSRINRLTNRIHLKGSGTDSRFINVHYSRCQLFIGNYEFPSEETGQQSRPVFATRLGTSSPHWQPMGRHYEWDRFAVSTTPSLPGHSQETPRIRVPWPAYAKPVVPPPTIYDTSAEAVKEITYKPFMLPADLKAPVPELAAEKPYIQSLFNPQVRKYDPAAPVEVHLQKELSNPHGRAKKQARWKAAQARKLSLMQEYMQAELADLKGRTRREARADAVWKWNQRLLEDKRAEKKRRWRNRGQEAKLERKKARKARKEQKQTERLQNLVLKEAPNQFVPPEYPQA
ncbi:hypothetical protein DENSPDRAFT_830823 [Dentipellis sp. KUC8613]|nr:hypothetical protein DENSPDRAFT_830823 [Dentipellis sp. KUC8613]